MSVELWNELAAKAGRALSEGQVRGLERYLELLADANTRMNLTRIVDKQQAEVAHVGDALTLLEFVPQGALKVVDVGSGGGVPGIPLAVALPECQITLVEATQKKAAFLQGCAKELGLGNVTVLAKRAEEVGNGAMREACDVVTARAVGELAFLVEWGIPLLKKGGKLLAMKGAKAQEEITGAERAIKLLNASPAAVHPVALPGAEHHVIVEITKLGRTDARFPRAATVAKGKAL
jgi:16S rRNA (guanine527-N7)-methyltransferase